MVWKLFGRRVEAPVQLEPQPELSAAESKPEPVYSLGVDREGKVRGIFKSDRIHVAVFGFPGTGKSTLLLSMILQHVRNDEGFLLIDPHGDLVKKLISLIPKEKWGRVIYVDPLTCFDERFKSVVQINFLEYEKTLDRDLVARVLMDSLSKIYSKFWGPRLDMIMMNAIYLLLEASSPRCPKFSEIYDILANDEYRETKLAKCSDEKVRSFWEKEFNRMPKDASSAVLTKIYRIVQERVIAPMFDCEKSSIDFRKAMDQGSFVIINLSEGAITSDLANFLGSLILARV